MEDYETALDEARKPPGTDTMLTPLAGPTATARSLLVRKLSDIVVLPSGRISSNERALAADILLQVLDKVEEPLRIEVARRVANIQECPPALVRMLLLDTAPVAEKMMARAEHVPEALLIEAAREGTIAHRLMIARRLDLTTSVADACLLYNELEVCKLVLRREECPLSPNAINGLVALSATNPELQTFLLRRVELEPAHGFMMFWWVGPDQRKRILTRFSLDRSVIQDALADLYPRVFRSVDKPDPFVKEILILAERRHRPRGRDGEPVSMDVVWNTLAAALRYPAQEIIDVVGMVGGISRELAARILRDPGGEPFAILAKSIGMSRDNFYSFFDGSSEELTPERGEYLLAVFDSMARDFARAILRYWDWDGNPRIAHITHLLGLNMEEIGEPNSY